MDIPHTVKIRGAYVPVHIGKDYVLVGESIEILNKDFIEKMKLMPYEATKIPWKNEMWDAFSKALTNERKRRR